MSEKLSKGNLAALEHDIKNIESTSKIITVSLEGIKNRKEYITDDMIATSIKSIKNSLDSLNKFINRACGILSGEIDVREETNEEDN